MDIFRPKIEDEGKSFIIRPLLNAKGLKNKEPHIVHYDIGLRGFMNVPIQGYLCFALVDDELKIIRFGKVMLDFIKSNSEHGADFLFMNNDKAIKMNVSVKRINNDREKAAFFNPSYEIVQDNKYRFDDTPEKRKYISDLLMNTELDLNDALKEEIEKVAKLKEKEEQRLKFADVDPYGEEDWGF
jgi:hypothetical protein